jgi:hypothetical protein
MELPLGYREFVTTFGRGELCEVLHVYMPSEIESSGYNDSERESLALLAFKNSQRKTLALLADHYRARGKDSPLTPDDLEQGRCICIDGASDVRSGPTRYQIAEIGVELNA